MKSTMKEMIYNLNHVRTDLETSISQLIALTISEQSGRQEALNEANDMNNIIRGTLNEMRKLQDW